MAAELIITSVRKGLEEGSGSQPVLRTRGMKPAVAERMQIRCGYPHPYSHGNPRNPVIFVHRIERVGGERLHLLARMCDAGSDHTGRSNMLAHLIAVPDAEARRLAAGPADVARRFPFKSSWNESAREAEPPTLIAADRGPATCGAWQAAGLDPGIAGDLAEAAAAGSEVRLIARERDDVLALLADALALVPPAKRWQVTFNTCEIEPFDATWRAIREDLPQAATVRGMPGVIDLAKSGTRGSEGVYARFARGEDVSLPWQTVVAPVVDAASMPAAGSPGIKPAAAGPTAAVRDAGTAAKASTAARQGPAPPPRAPGKRNLLEQVNAKDLTAGDEGTRKPNRLPIILLTSVIAIALIAIGALAFVSQKPDAVAWLAAIVRDKVSEQSPPRKVDVSADEQATKDSDPSDEAEKRREREEAEKKEEAARRQEEAEQEKRKLRDAEMAEAERRRKEAEDMAAATRAKENEAEKKQKAFAQFLALPRIIPSDIPPSSNEPLPIKLGPLDAENLVGLQFEIAVPKERPGSPLFKARVNPPATDTPEWVVQTGGQGLDKTTPTLATLSVTGGTLWMTPAKLPPGLRALLRRSVLLAKATDPDETDKSVILPIQLLVPTDTPAPFSEPLVGMHERHEEIKLKSPTGITVSPSGTNEAPKLPIDDAVIEYTVTFPYDRKGIKKPATHENKLLEHGQGAYCDLLEQLLPPDPKTTIGVFVELSHQAGVVTVQTKVEGPGAENIDLKILSDWAGRTDKAQDKYAKDVITSVKQFVSKLMKSTPVDFERSAQPALRSLVTLQSKGSFRDYEGDFGSFFVREKRFTTMVDAPNEKDKKVPKVVTDPDECLRMWNERCEEIVSRPPHPDPTKDMAEWKKEFVDVIKNWAADWEPRFLEYAELKRRCSRPLAEDVTVTVTRITSKAYSDDKTEYTVTLSTPTARSQTKAGDRDFD